MDPAKIWEDLKNIHEARGFASRLALHRKFLWLSKADDQPMQNWIAVVRHTAFCLTQIGVEVSDEDFILVLTQGLPATYKTFVVSLDATDPSLLMSEYVICRLLNEEVHQSGPKEQLSTPQKDAVFQVDKKQKRPLRPIEEITCYKCQQKGHYQSQCPENVKPEAHSIEESAGLVVEESEGVW